MSGSNYNFGASYIMNSDQTSVDDAMGSNKLYREGLEFDTKAKPCNDVQRLTCIMALHTHKIVDQHCRR